MSDGFHDNPYSWQKRFKHVPAKPSSDGKWFACPECGKDLPASAWAAAHLKEDITCVCQTDGCGVHVDLPEHLFGVKKNAK